MNTHKAGLYVCATISTWLLATGLASPPVHVLLGLTLPDSRILNGIAGIGLTLADIADLIPYLRQPTINATTLPIDDMPAASGISTLEDGTLPLNGSHTMQIELSSMTSFRFVTGSSCAASASSGRLTLAELSNDLHDALSSPPMPPLQQDHWALPEIQPPPHSDADATGVEDAALYIPLLAPDTVEDCLFISSAVSSIVSLQGVCATTAGAEAPTVQIPPAIVDDGPMTTTENILKQDNPVAEHASTSSTRDMIRDGSPVAGVPNADECEIPTSTRTSVRDQMEPENNGAHVGTLPSQNHIIESAQTAQGQEVKQEQNIQPKRLRPESLVFIPQSVVRRFPSTPLVSAAPRYAHQTVSHDYPAVSVPPTTLGGQEAMLLGEAIEATRANAFAIGVTSGERPRVPAVFQREDILNKKADVTSKELSIAGRGLGVRPSTDQGLLNGEQASIQGLMPKAHTLRLGLSRSRRRLGVLARAALRNRRYNRSGSDHSDSDSASDSDSQSSESSSGDESVLPRMLGSDLIAAIDANSEWELSLYQSRNVTASLPDIHEDILAPADSTANVSLIMHGPSTIDASDTDVRAPTNSRPLTYEDIQNWATGVVHTCVKRVYRNHVPAPPRSPSQVSDVCAERPLIPGVSRCPLAGHHHHHHRSPVASTAAGAPAPKDSNTPVALPAPATTQPQRPQKPLVVRNIRDIPEFVPRQRPIPVVTSKSVERQSRYRTSTMVRVSVHEPRDAAGEVIARVESRVGFHPPGRREAENRAYWAPARTQLERHAERYPLRLA